MSSEERDETQTEERESAPLLSSQTDGDDTGSDNEEEELNRFRLFALTCTLGGLQVFWAILFSNINTFLQSIGFPNSVAAAIWVIAPACGTTVQPVVGWLSDRTSTRFGRRKPYIFVGAILTTICFVGLTYTKNMCDAITQGPNHMKVLTGVTLTWVIAVNIAVQPLQMGIRAFIVDGCPRSQQAQANAWAGGALGFGNVLGYLVSYATDAMKIDRPEFNRYNLLAFVSSFCIIVTVAINLIFATEKYGQPASADQDAASLSVIFKQLRRSRMVSHRANLVNRVQLIAWLGWFPFMFYQVGYVSSFSKPSMKHVAAEQTTEAGTRAAFFYALMTGVGSWIIPLLLRKTKQGDAESDLPSSAPPSNMLGVSLEKVWCASQILYGCLLLLTLAAFNTAGATAIIAVVGLCFAFSNYIPYALIGIEVAQARRKNHTSTPDHGGDGDDAVDDSGMAEGDVTLGTGATQGILNASISAPQIVSALVSSGILALFDRYHVKDGTGWVLRIAGLPALGAAVQIRSLFR